MRQAETIAPRYSQIRMAVSFTTGLNWETICKGNHGDHSLFQTSRHVSCHQYFAHQRVLCRALKKPER
jgi:hypothetical protein